jgi:hypothetical protein
VGGAADPVSGNNVWLWRASDGLIRFVVSTGTTEGSVGSLAAYASSTPTVDCGALDDYDGGNNCLIVWSGVDWKRRLNWAFAHVATVGGLPTLVVSSYGVRGSWAFGSPSVAYQGAPADGGPILYHKWGVAYDRHSDFSKGYYLEMMTGEDDFYYPVVDLIAGSGKHMVDPALTADSYTAGDTTYFAAIGLFTTRQ